jgi:hypothetical protein
MTAVTASSDRWAFKEWAVICRALATGRQDVILRKGGIVEPGGQFRLESREFLLLPTFLHQSAESILPKDRDLLEGIESDRPQEGLVAFHHRARVTDAFAVSDEAALVALRPRHIWSDVIVEERFHRWRRRLDVLVVTVTPLPAPLIFAWHDSYAGCKSWVQVQGEPIERVA